MSCCSFEHIDVPWRRSRSGGVARSPSWGAVSHPIARGGIFGAPTPPFHSLWNCLRLLHGAAACSLPRSFKTGLWVLRTRSIESIFFFRHLFTGYLLLLKMCMETQIRPGHMISPLRQMAPIFWRTVKYQSQTIHASKYDLYLDPPKYLRKWDMNL